MCILSQTCSQEAPAAVGSPSRHLSSRKRLQAVSHVGSPGAGGFLQLVQGETQALSDRAVSRMSRYRMRRVYK